jgi:ABC-2 type transport system permease protein
VLLVASVLLAVPFGALSNAMGLTLRRTESVIGASNFILLPMIFLSQVFMAPTLMPAWIRRVAQFNPVGWAVESARSAMSPHPDWALITTNLSLLVGLTFVASWVATRAFRSYQKSA